MPEPLALTLNAAAEALSVSPRTVRRLLDAGELGRVKIGRAVRVSSASLHAYVDRQITPGHNAAGVAVHGEPTCHDVKPRPDREKASTNGRARRTGGPSTQTDAGGRLAAVLGFDAPRTRKD